MKLFVVLFSLLLVQALSASPEQPLKVIIFESKPWAAYDSNHQVNGIVVDWFNKISEQARIPIVINLGNVSRIFKDLEYGRADLSIEFKPYVKGESLIPIIAIAPLTSKIYAKTTILKTFNWSDLYHEKVCVVRGGLYGLKFTEDDNIDKVLVNTYDQLVSMLSLNRCKYVAAVESGFKYAIKQSGINSNAFEEKTTLDIKHLHLIYSAKTFDHKISEKLIYAVSELKKQQFFILSAKAYLE